MSHTLLFFPLQKRLLSNSSVETTKCKGLVVDKAGQSKYWIQVAGSWTGQFHLTKDPCDLDVCSFSPDNKSFFLPTSLAAENPCVVSSHTLQSFRVSVAKTFQCFLLTVLSSTVVPVLRLLIVHIMIPIKVILWNSYLKLPSTVLSIAPHKINIIFFLLSILYLNVNMVMTL